MHVARGLSGAIICYEQQHETEVLKCTDPTNYSQLLRSDDGVCDGSSDSSVRVCVCVCVCVSSFHNDLTTIHRFQNHTMCLIIYDIL